jgi:hypothetical protein
MVNKDGAMGHRRELPQRLTRGVRPDHPDTRTPRPRSIEDAHPSCISKVRNVTTPMGSGREEGKIPFRPVSHRQRRHPPQRDKIAQEAKAGTPKGKGKA